MWSTVPAQVATVDAHRETATVAVDEMLVEVPLVLAEEVGVGDYLLVHGGYAVQKVSEEEAMRALELFFEEGLMA
ncbi:MAG: HypC/HybG/HupF family hydrogenase formation chaperone [Methylomonas sp.]